MIFATRHQLDLLNRAKSWYVDATFKLCRQPLTQLLTVNAFVKADDYVKQVPLVFVLMSGKRKRDYRAVFRELLELLPSPALRQVTLDFECAVWKVLRQLPMYLLIDLLYKEAKLTSLNVRMVSEKKLRRVQRRRYRQIQAKVFSLWGQYEEGDKTARQLLKACSLLVGPRGA